MSLWLVSSCDSCGDMKRHLFNLDMGLWSDKSTDTTLQVGEPMNFILFLIRVWGGVTVGSRRSCEWVKCMDMAMPRIPVPQPRGSELRGKAKQASPGV